MRKLNVTTAALLSLALRPAFAASPSAPITTTFPTVDVTQATPVTADTRCFVGTATGAAPGSVAPVQFVGNVLCLDPGPNGDFASFAQNCPRDTTPVVQSVTLTKIEPLIPKCPDTFPGATFIQTARSTGIRTWWTLKHTPCDTLFRLEISFGCIRAAGRDRGTIAETRVNCFTFRVSVAPRNLSWVIQALHNEPLGLCEVPCITDESLFELLLRQARTIRLEHDAGSSRIREFNQALDVMEATIVANCLFVTTIATIDRDRNGNITQIFPCAIFPGEAPPGNFTIPSLGFGIVDSLENPCCCKLIADIFCLKKNFIGNHV